MRTMSRKEEAVVRELILRAHGDASVVERALLRSAAESGGVADIARVKEIIDQRFGSHAQQATPTSDNEREAEAGCI
jgi:hypothetical protein